MAGAVDVGGVFHHGGPAPGAAEVLACVGGRHGVVVEKNVAPLFVAARYSTSARIIGEHDEVIAFVVGPVTNRETIDRTLGTHAKNAAQSIAAAYARFGTDAFLRLTGRYACVVWDGRDKRLILARSGGAGGSPALHYVRDGKRTVFATRLEYVPNPELARDDLTRWAEDGRWPAADRGPYRDVEVVPPGHAVVIYESGRKRERTVWSFAPRNVPREMPAHEARAELDDLLETSLARIKNDVALVGEPALTTFLDRRLAAKKRRAHAQFVTTDADAILRAARHVELPVPLSRLLALAKLLRDPGTDLVFDWGAREALGGTGPAMRAWIRAVAHALDRDPGSKAIVDLLRLAWPVDRRLGTPRLHRDVLDVGRGVARRWSKRLPGVVQRRVAGYLDEAPSDAPSWTTDVFVDHRFAETTDATLSAAHTALIRLAQTNGRRAVVPFLARDVIELLFSIPTRYFVRDRRAMWLLDGGVPIEPPPIVAAPDALTLRLDDWLSSASTTLHGAPAEGADRATLDRWLGLAAWVFSRHPA
ncbi:MAG: hypothetical protein RIT81_45470 [Deltaproteobacteria bacterium]